MNINQLSGLNYRQLIIKRSFDIIFSILGLAVLVVPLVLLIIIAFFDTGMNGIYNQQRIGRYGKKFSIFKIRTMKSIAGVNTTITTLNDKRITAFGRIIRKLKLDEIPQLINVLMGDMSLVGPRPLLPEYLYLYSENQKKRHNVRPGITGWAQVNGRNSISWEEKFKLDIWYVHNQSILLDLKILLLSIKKVIISDGISQKNQATVEPFKGNK